MFRGIFILMSSSYQSIKFMLKRTFIPGSEWLYLKLYSGKLSADAILTGWLLPAYNNLVHSQLVTKMFYLRYADPDTHLRVRFHLVDPRYLGKVLTIIHKTLQPYSDNGTIWKIELGTYEREIERYGGSCIEQIEAIFACDSFFIIQDLATCPPSERWKMACKYIEQLFDVLKFTLTERMSTMNTMQASFRKEKGLDSVASIHKLNHNYRLLRKTIEESLAAHKHDEHYLALSRIITTDVASRITRCVPDIIHMINNRIFVSFPRHNEAVLYYFLFKSYSSLIARANET